ncbi:MAG: S1 family peptidase [Parvularcula sp.]|jgi:hypothetical protein|nr:S1 family peptidase [Parvularcula sp.]
MLQDQAAQYGQELLVTNPSGFVDLEIRHQPNFKVFVYYDKDIDRKALTSAAPVKLRRFLVFNPINKSRAQLQQDREAIHNSLSNAGLRFGLEFTLRTGKFVLTIPETAEVADYETVLPDTMKADVEIIQGPLSANLANLYGGWWFQQGATGGYCTAGWPIRDSSGREGLLTAGHCGPAYEMAFTWMDSPYPKISPPSARQEGDNGWQTLDYAMYPLGAHATTRVIYVQNDTSYSGYMNTVPGITTTYYEITSPRQPANGQYLCKSGGTTGLTCGIVVDRNYSDSEVKNLVKVSKSSQPYIAAGGDSGGPVFTWSADGSMVHPIGIMQGGSEYGSGAACRNSSSTAANNSQCYFTVMPLTTIRGYSPFTINTTSGFVSP